MKGLFLDDERNPEDVTWIKYPEGIEWIVVRNSEELSDYMHDMSFDIYSFDHDLQDFWEIPEGTVIGLSEYGDVLADKTTNGEHTGYTLLQEMISNWEILPNFDLKHLDKIKFVFHTQNPIGKKNMESYYQNYLKFMKEYLWTIQN